MNEDDLVEDPFAYNPILAPFDEKDEKLLRDMQGRAIIVDLGRDSELYEDWTREDEELILPDRETHDCQAMACDCMNEIESLEDDSVFEKMAWNEYMAYNPMMLVPIEIRMVHGPTGNYPRFWGYICQQHPESEYLGVKKATISLPSGLSKRIAAFNEDMLNMKASPLEDSKVHMILTTYHGLEEFEVNDEKRKAHKFRDTKIIEGHRSLE